MLRQIMRSIARFLAAMPRFVTERVWNDLRWISRLVAAPAAPVEPEAEPMAAVNTDGDGEHVAAMRTAAAHLAAGQVPPEAASARLRPFDVEWLKALDQKMLCRVATASDAALRAHIRRTGNIRGVLATEPAAINDYRKARDRQPIPALEVNNGALSPA